MQPHTRGADNSSSALIPSLAAVCFMMCVAVRCNSDRLFATRKESRTQCKVVVCNKKESRRENTKCHECTEAPTCSCIAHSGSSGAAASELKHLATHLSLHIPDAEAAQHRTGWCRPRWGCRAAPAPPAQAARSAPARPAGQSTRSCACNDSRSRKFMDSCMCIEMQMHGQLHPGASLPAIRSTLCTKLRSMCARERFAHVAHAQ